MNLFIYPHCHIKSTATESLVYDGKTGQSVYLNSLSLSECERENLSHGLLEINNPAKKEFAELCIQKKMGYYLHDVAHTPFVIGRDINIKQSLTKERNCLGYNLASSTNQLLKKITILLNSSIEWLTENECLQIEYPYNNNCDINIDYIINQLSSFEYLEEIVLAGEFNAEILESVATYAKEHGLIIIYRMIYTHEHKAILPIILGKYKCLLVELITRPTDAYNDIEQIANERLIIKGLIKNIEDVESFRYINFINYIPVLSKENDGLVKHLIVSQSDVLDSRKSTENCNLSSVINTGAYSRLIINYDGIVMCLGRSIDSLYKRDLSDILNKWIGEDHCAWFYTRAKKDSCRNCALQCVCPPISIYEVLEFYKCPCSHY